MSSLIHFKVKESLEFLENLCLHFVICCFGCFYWILITLPLFCQRIPRLLIQLLFSGGTLPLETKTLSCSFSDSGPSVHCPIGYRTTENVRRWWKTGGNCSTGLSVLVLPPGDGLNRPVQLKDRYFPSCIGRSKSHYGRFQRLRSETVRTILGVVYVEGLLFYPRSRLESDWKRSNIRVTSWCQSRVPSRVDDERPGHYVQFRTMGWHVRVLSGTDLYEPTVRKRSEWKEFYCSRLGESLDHGSKERTYGEGKHKLGVYGYVVTDSF